MDSNGYMWGSLSIPLDSMLISLVLPLDLLRVDTGFSIRFLRISSRVPYNNVWIEAATSHHIGKLGLHPPLSSEGEGAIPISIKRVKVAPPNP